MIQALRAETYQPVSHTYSHISAITANQRQRGRKKNINGNSSHDKTQATMPTCMPLRANKWLSPE